MTAEVDLVPRVLEAVENLTEEGSVGFYASAIVTLTDGNPVEVTRILLKMVEEKTLEPRFELRCPDNGRRITSYEEVGDIPLGEEVQSDHCESEESFVVDETDVYIRFRLNLNSTAALRRRMYKKGGGRSGKGPSDTSSSGGEPPRQPVPERAPQPTIDSFTEYRNRGQITSTGGGLQLNVIGDVRIDTSSREPSSTPSDVKRQKTSKRIADHVRENTIKFVLEVIAGICVIVLAAWLGLNSGGGSSTTSSVVQRPRHHISPYGQRADMPFTVENSVRTGVWALKSPVMTSFSGRRERPVNAARWLPNGTVVHAHCARPGTAYELKLAGRFTRWRFFAELKDGTYTPMAGFRQTTEDGAQHLVRCEVS